MTGKKLTIITDDLFKDALKYFGWKPDSVPHIFRSTKDAQIWKPKTRLYLLALFSCMWQNVATENGIIESCKGAYKLNIRKFAKWMGMDAASGKSADIMAALQPLEGYSGIINNEVYNVLKVICPEDEEHEVILSLPYLDKLQDALIDREEDSRNPVVHDHVSASICRARCIPAADLVIDLTLHLAKRGLKPDGQFRKNQGVKLADRQVIIYRVSKEKLIERNASVNSIVCGCADTDNKNIQLKRVFANADKLLHDQTDIFEYYKDFQIIGFTAPRAGRKWETDSKEKIVIRHYGANDLTEKKNAADQTTKAGTEV